MKKLVWRKFFKKSWGEKFSNYHNVCVRILQIFREIKYLKVKKLIPRYFCPVSFHEIFDYMPIFLFWLDSEIIFTKFLLSRFDKITCFIGPNAKSHDLLAFKVASLCLEASACKALIEVEYPKNQKKWNFSCTTIDF